MVMTEAEAREKWCPHVRAGGSFDPNAANCATHPEGRLPEYSRCIASDCMAWRRHGDKRAPITPEAKIVAQDRDNSPHEAFAIVPTGYCGLAGRP